MAEPHSAESIGLEIAASRARILNLRAAVARAERHARRLERIIELVPGAVWESEDGRDVWVETHITLRRDDSGAVVGRSVVAPDVTERVLLEQAHAENLARSQQLAQRRGDIIASVPGLVWEIQGGPASPMIPVFLSDYLTTLTGHHPDDLLGKPWLWEQTEHAHDQLRVERQIEQIYASGNGTVQHRLRTRDDRVLWVETYMQVMYDDAGTPTGAHGVTMDIHARKVAEEERVQLKSRIIEAQEARLAEISAPLIPLSANILIMPLIGTIDEARAARVIEALLQGISRARAKVAILDITGARSIDAQAVDGLLQAARAVRFLGAEVILTGIRPDVASILVDLRADLQDLLICGTLESGIARATALL